MRALKISPQLSLPVDVAGEAIAILAKRGAGKTNTATVLVEELHGAAVQVVVLDPVGAWWGLRSSAEGGKGLPIPILGGEHGDVPLEPTSGALIADVVVDSGESVLLDLSDFPSKAAHARFVVDFAERLYRRKARERQLVHLVLEEADSFAPQKVRGDDARMAGAIEAIVRRGRSRGIGITMVTQRSAVLNKDVLSQADVLIAMRTTSPHDLKAIEAWIDTHADREEAAEFRSSLASLDTGEAWIWNPERGLFDRVKVRRRRTFDSSATPKAGETRTQPKAAAPIDLAALGEQIQATAERARDNDPAELRKRIRELEKQRAVDAEVRVEERVVHITQPVSVLTDDDRALLSKLDALGTPSFEQWRADLAALEDVVSRASAVAAAKPAPTPRQREEHSRRVASAPRVPRPVPVVAGGAGVTTSQQRILDTLAWFEQLGIAAPARAALAPMAGSRATSGGFKNNLGALRTAGLIDYPQPNRVRLTDVGRASATPPSIDATDAALQEAVCAAVTGSQAAIVRALIAVFPAPLSRDELAEQIGVPVTSGGFKNNLGALRTLEVIDYPEPGYVAALPILFPVSHGGS